MNQITCQDFQEIEIRVGTVVAVEDFPEAIKPAFKLSVDFGNEFGIKRSSAQVTDLYEKNDLIGRQVVAVTNLGPKQIGPFVSEVLITGFHRDDGSVVLAVPDRPVGNGARLA